MKFNACGMTTRMWTVIVVLPLLSLTMNETSTAWAQSASRPATAAYNIPAGSLGTALSRFASESGLLLSSDANLTAGKRTSGLQGEYTIEQALQQLLAGTGLQPRFSENGAVTLERVARQEGDQSVVLPLLTVSTAHLKQGTAEEGYRVSNVSGIGLWDERSLRDTPYSMSVVTSDLIENVNAQDMGQIFKMNPLTQEPYIQGANNTPIIIIRGFESLNPVYDGIPLTTQIGSAVSVIEIDRVEILSGTSGFLYGGGRVGGAVNYVTKNSTDVPLRRLTFGNYGGTQFYGHADIGGKFDDQGRFGYRANLLYQGGDTAIGEPVTQKVANIVLDGHITDTLYADIKYTYNDYSREATQPQFYPRERASIDTSKRYAPKWASNDLESHKAYTSLRWDPSKYFTLRSAFFYQQTTVNANQIALREQADRTFIPQVVVNPGHKYENYGGYIYLDSQFSTFAIDHKLTLGYSSTFNELFRRPRAYLSDVNSFLLDELKHLPEPDLEAYRRAPRESIWQEQYNNILIGDNITFNDQWSAMVGLNYATTKNAYTGYNYDKSKLTPTVSLMYKPIEPVTAYVSYMEALEAGTVVDNFYANGGEVLPPMISKQYEAGLKYDINPSLLLSTALFRIEKANQYQDNAIPQPNLLQDGLQVHNGVELVLTGKVTDNLTVMAGGTLMDLSVEKAESPDLEGKKPFNAASRMGKIYAEYALPWIRGLSLTGGVYYTGEKYGNAANTDKIPSYTLYDIGARYTTRVLDKSLVVRLNVINLTGKDYWQNVNFLGVPRTVAFSASMSF